MEGQNKSLDEVARKFVNALFENDNLTLIEIGIQSFKAGASYQSERERGLVKALEEIEEIVLKYHKINGNSPAANHCRNIALQALSNHKP